MIVLDTNVLSELAKSHPDPRVSGWTHRTPENKTTTSVTIGELWTGAFSLPFGKRRSQLESAINRVLDDLPSRLDYDNRAAYHYARFRTLANSSGRGLCVEDGMIAAICAANDAALATRNTSDFDFLPIRLINPWEI
jgi:toxin FitB